MASKSKAAPKKVGEFLSLDFSNVDNFDALPEGEYEVLIESVEKTEAKSGNPMLKVQYVVERGPHENRKLWDNVVLIPTTLWKLSSLMKACGMSDPSGQSVVKFYPSDLVGMSLGVVVAQEDYQDTMKNTVKGYFSTGGKGGKDSGKEL